jgi:hypothetical protein
VTIPQNRDPSAEAPGTEAGQGSPAGLVIICLVFVLLMVAFGFGPMILAERRNARILKEGIPAKARVTRIVPTGNYHNDQPEVRISLEVTPDTGEPFDSKVETYMSPVYLPRFQPGSVVDVRFDPKKREDVALIEP